jgi:2-polyprenyl-6-methoxyphenol hydroxylase-like FAD-dependent oxidoreductase
MSEFHGRLYDVAIMGGGPAGATLGARIARETQLSVAIFEAEYFPRDHIGETFVHTIVPCLQESGALPKVLASECWVKKYGGYYAWSDRPWSTYFDHALHEMDGQLRWAIHCNRPEFDHVLLEHARASGAEVFEGTPITGVVREDGVTRIALGDFGETRARIFVNCSGRTGSTTITGERAFLSNYRNIAIWNHIVGGARAQSLPGDWNIFRERNLSPVGSFMFEDGWFWYIPVPKIVQGKRVLTHSLGMVTDPAVLRQPNKRYTDPAVFMQVARSVPFLGQLIGDAQLVSDKFLTATNYSRISERMCDYDLGEIRIGDAAYFVDPLFSSGVHFALLHSSAALVLIKASTDGSLPEATVRDLWGDYDGMLRSVARGFALGIDQWYNEIANENPGSVYWRLRGDTPTFAAREDTFMGLVNGSIHGDLLQVITKGTNAIGLLGKEGALRRTYQLLEDREPAAETVVRLRPNVHLKTTVTLEAPAFWEGKPAPFIHGAYWEDPDAHAAEVRQLFPGPIPCHSFFFADGENEARVRFFESEHRGLELYERLRKGGETYEKLKESLAPPQQHLLLHLLLSDMLVLG